MAIPKNKEELLDVIKETYNKLRLDIKELDNNTSNIKELEWQVKWTVVSVNNLLSYLIWRWELVLKWHKIKNEWSEPDFPETWYKWNELWKLAQKFYEDYEDKTIDELKKLLDETVNKILTLIELKSNAELYECLWYWRWTMWRMIQFNTSSPYKNIRTRIRKWKKEKWIK